MDSSSELVGSSPWSGLGVSVMAPGSGGLSRGGVVALALLEGDLSCANLAWERQVRREEQLRL